MSTVQTYKAVFEGGVFRLLPPSKIDIPEGQRVRLAIEPIDSPKDIVTLATRVYDGLSETDIEELEAIFLDRETFFKDRDHE